MSDSSSDSEGFDWVGAPAVAANPAARLEMLRMLVQQMRTIEEASDEASVAANAVRAGLIIEVRGDARFVGNRGRPKPANERKPRTRANHSKYRARARERRARVPQVAGEATVLPQRPASR